MTEYQTAHKGDGIMRNYQETIKRHTAEHGDKFSASDLSRQFIPYYENGARIKVESFGDILTGQPKNKRKGNNENQRNYRSKPERL